MPRIESMVSPYPAGSGRWVDLAYPGIGQPITGGAITLFGSSRNQPPGISTLSWWGKNGPLGNWTLYKGLSAAAIGTVDPNRGGLSSDSNGAIRQQLEHHPAPVEYDIHHVQIVTIIAAFPTAASAVGRDYGLFWNRSQQLTSSIITNGGQGMGFYVDVNGILNFIYRGPVGLTTIPAPTIDPKEWHAYRIMFTGAGATAEASVSAQVDDTVIATLEWSDPNAPLYSNTSDGGGQWTHFILAAAGCQVMLHDWRMATSETALGCQ